MARSKKTVVTREGNTSTRGSRRSATDPTTKGGGRKTELTSTTTTARETDPGTKGGVK